MAARPTLPRKRSKAFPVRLAGPVDAFVATLAHVAPNVTQILPLIERANPGAIAAVLAAGEGPGLTRARALDTSVSTTADPLIDHFVDRIIETPDTDKDLIALSATCPRGRDRDVVPLMREYVARAADAGDSAWLVRDLRRKKKIGGEHAYGLVSCERGGAAEAIDAWIGLTDASAKCVRAVPVTGWEAFASGGDASVLRLNLAGSGDRHGAVSYALKPLPRGIPRDLDFDVASSGFLDDAWGAARGLDAGMVALPLRERFCAMGQSVPRACLVCGASLLGKRSHAEVCSVRCRMRRRKRSRKDGAP